MRKIIVGAQVSMDGVMQAPGGPTEDPTRGFTFGGWVVPYFHQEFGEEIDRLFCEKFAKGFIIGAPVGALVGGVLDGRYVS